MNMQFVVSVITMFTVSACATTATQGVTPVRTTAETTGIVVKIRGPGCFAVQTDNEFNGVYTVEADRAHIVALNVIPESLRIIVRGASGNITRVSLEDLTTPASRLLNTWGSCTTLERAMCAGDASQAEWLGYTCH